MIGTVCLTCNGANELPAMSLVAVCRHGHLVAADRICDQVTLDEAMPPPTTPGDPPHVSHDRKFQKRTP